MEKKIDSLYEMIQKLTKNVEEMGEKILVQTKKITDDKNEIKEIVETHEYRITKIEKEKIDRILIIHGVKEEERNYWEMERTILNIINKTIKVQCYGEEIYYLHTMGKKQEGRIRPIKMSLTTWRKKILILKGKKALKEQEIYIEEEIPKHLIGKQKELKVIMMQKRQDNKHAIIKKGVLYVDGKLYEESEMKGANENNDERTKRKNRSTSDEKELERVEKAFKEREQSKRAEKTFKLKESTGAVNKRYNSNNTTSYELRDTRELEKYVERQKEKTTDKIDGRGFKPKRYND